MRCACASVTDPLLVDERGARYFTVANLSAARFLGNTLDEMRWLGPSDVTPPTVSRPCSGVRA